MRAFKVGTSCNLLPTPSKSYCNLEQDLTACVPFTTKRLQVLMTPKGQLPLRCYCCCCYQL